MNAFAIPDRGGINSHPYVYMGYLIFIEQGILALLFYLDAENRRRSTLAPLKSRDGSIQKLYGLKPK
jgi:hypothetical protein